MKVTLSTTVLLALVGRIIFFANPIFAENATTNSVSQTNEPSPFQIIVAPRKNQVHIGESFKVLLEVKNTSNTEQRFAVWSCSWTHNWKSSNPSVRLVGLTCNLNGPRTINLASGEFFKVEINGTEMKMQVSQNVSTNRISFRVGFTPMILVPMQFYDSAKRTNITYQGPINGDKTYWSDEVTIRINPKPKFIPDWIPW